jgi:peptidoglycan/xylan/chitin deacetylase (PgdA/CDA1 family)
MDYIDRYEQIKKLRPFKVRSVLRDIVLDGLSLIDKINDLKRYLDRPRIQFLYIHHVFKDEERNLEKLILRLSENHFFLSYSEAVDRLCNNDIDKPYIVISSDDGFENNLRAGEILSANGISACFFVNPSIINEPNYEVIKRFCNEKLNFPPIKFLDWKGVNRLQKLGHEIGSHTMTHLNIAMTPLVKVIGELNESYAVLKSNCGEVKHFAFPYGRFFHFNELSRKEVFNAGFVSCATAERGCHISHNRPLSTDELCILRDHVILDWNLDHVFHFIANNSRNANIKNNLFPYRINESDHSY